MQTPMIAFKPHYEHQKVDVNANECVRAPRNARHDWLLKLTNGVYLKFTIHNMWTNPIVGVYSPKKLACAIHTFLSVYIVCICALQVSETEIGSKCLLDCVFRKFTPNEWLSYYNVIFFLSQTMRNSGPKMFIHSFIRLLTLITFKELMG